MQSTEAGAMTPTRQRPRAVRIACGAGCIAALIPLLWLDSQQRQVGLYFSWLAAMGLFLLRWPWPRGWVRWRPSPALGGVLVVYVGLVLFAFCRVYDNWRWAVTGDSLNFFVIGQDLARGNPAVNWLSVRGVFEQCTVVQATLQSVFMHLSESLFAHRLGNVLTSALIVLAAAAFAAETSGATAAVLLALFLPLHSVFDYFTLISYPNLSGLLPYFAAYALFGAAWTVWESGFLWAALGLVCGLAGYFLPLWFAAVASVSAAVVLSAIYWRAPSVFLIWASGVAIALIPALLQLSTFLHVLFWFQPGSGLSLSYILAIAQQAALLPFASTLGGYGSNGPWLRPPFGYLWLAGVGLAAVSGVLALLRRPRGRVLRHAWIWLVLLASDVAGLSLANSGYPVVSVKRAIVMLPNMTFLMILPLAWVAERIGRTWVTGVLMLAALLPFAYLNLTTLWTLESGYNVPDGMVRAVQTLPGQLLLVSQHPDLHNDFGPSRPDRDPVQELYHVRDRTIVTSVIPAQRSDFERVVCYSRHVDGLEWGAQVQAALAQLCPGKPIEQLTAHLECVTCDPA